MDVFTSTPACKGGRGKALDRSRRNRLASTTFMGCFILTMFPIGLPRVRCLLVAFTDLLVTFQEPRWLSCIRWGLLL